ncbi:hypothetical protein C8F01DRAFT_1375639 [Mycena amicta]|nr:hypothetical protein C8F01DRAFT_1375639 [Mycena amicta]
MVRNYDYENLNMAHLPKHWDVSSQRVVTWLPWLSRTYPIESLLGTYSFVAVRNDPKRGESTGTLGTLQLGLYAGPALTWENVSGSFDLAGAAKGTFVSLTAPHTSAILDPASFGGPPRQTLRYFDLTSSYMGSVPLRGHALEVLDAVDELGNNYIAFMLEHASKGSKAVAYLGKKQSAGSIVGLSDAERRQLGIGSTFEEVEREGAC